MTTYVLEMRSTADWSDVRYREYTTSAKKAELFKDVPKIKFTDSGHGIVPHVSEHKKGPRAPRNLMLADHVRDHVTAIGRLVKPKRPSYDKAIVLLNRWLTLAACMDWPGHTPLLRETEQFLTSSLSSTHRDGAA